MCRPKSRKEHGNCTDPVEVSTIDVAHVSEQTGFRPLYVEKTIGLLSILQELIRHESLQGLVALKGGTALHLFHMPHPARLSEDIDLQWLGDGDSLEAVRAADRSIHEICDALHLGLTGKSRLGKPTQMWYVTYAQRFREGIPKTPLKVDINFGTQTLREPEIGDSCQLGAWQVRDVPVMDKYEVAAGKCAALMGRRRLRDLYDVYEVLNTLDLDFNLLQQTFLAVGAKSNKDWSQEVPRGLHYDAKRMSERVLPLLRTKEQDAIRDDLSAFGHLLLRDARAFIDRLRTYTPEQEQWLEARLSGRLAVDAWPPVARP